jgi:hypothetical protein
LFTAKGNREAKTDLPFSEAGSRTECPAIVGDESNGLQGGCVDVEDDFGARVCLLVAKEKVAALSGSARREKRPRAHIVCCLRAIGKNDPVGPYSGLPGHFFRWLKSGHPAGAVVCGCNERSAAPAIRSTGVSVLEPIDQLARLPDGQVFETLDLVFLP